MGADGELVAHGAGGDEEGGGEAGEVGNVRFESVGGGVFGEDVVEKRRVLDGGQHGWGRGCDYIT